MTSIPTTSPDVETWLIGLLGGALSPIRAHNVKPAAADSYKHLVVRADLQNKVTPISRYCRVGIQAWVVSEGRADLGAAFDLAALAGRTLEAAPRVGILIDAEIDSGPLRVMDDIAKIEFAYVTLLLEVAV